ncbi:MAG: peptidase T [Erysipelotrichales bacterium]
MEQKMLDRFIGYTKIDTQSDPSSSSIPSTKKQYDMINLLSKQLDALKVEHFIDDKGFLNALIKSNSNKEISKVGFLAHVDTAPDYNGKDVNAQVIENYQGQDIPFKDGGKLSAKQFPELLDYINQTIITTDGTSLLGGDDKAGVSIIMEMIEYFVANPEVEHGDIYIAFTIDEEIGTGVDNFDLSFFKPDFAYTIDGGEIGEFSYETFNAAGLSLNLKGLNVHPGDAKDKMINAMEAAYYFHSLLPALAKPEHTEDYEGFIMLMGIDGSVENTSASYIIRDHSMEKFNAKKELVEKAIKQTLNAFPGLEIDYTLKNQYYNMKEKVVEKQEAIDVALAAYKKNDVDANVMPIRGGTDGSKLSFREVPCPNIFTGGHNFHGKNEFTCLDSMVKAKDIIIDIVKLLAQD